MILESLTVAQFRAFESRTKFTFDPRFTVIVGENGVGKTSVLTALRVMLSHMLPMLVQEAPPTLTFAEADVTYGWPYLRVEASALLSSHDKIRLECAAQKHESKFRLNTLEQGQPRESAVETPDIIDLKLLQEVTNERGEETSRQLTSWEGSRDSHTPLVVYYSAHRSVAVNQGSNSARVAGGVRAAFAEALVERELKLKEAALLWRRDAVLEEMDGLPAHANKAIERALPSFLPGFHSIRVEDSPKDPRMLVNKGRVTLNLSQLSDGERGVLALLLDLTRRLAQANPDLKDPARDGQAIVLIDEIDLHMHPTWQRNIVSQLLAAFPKCQFITTTHSPQIISEVQPESLLLLRRDDHRLILERRDQAFGLDANYVLEYIMGTPPRAESASMAISAVEDAIDEGNLVEARTRLAKLRTLLNGDDPVVVALEARIYNLEAFRDASHTEED